MIRLNVRALVVDGLTRFRCSLFAILDLLVRKAWANCSCFSLSFRLWYLKAQWPGWLREKRKVLLDAHVTTSRKHREYLNYSFCWVKNKKQHKAMAIYLLIFWALFFFFASERGKEDVGTHANETVLARCQWPAGPIAQNCFCSIFPFYFWLFVYLLLFSPVFEGVSSGRSFTKAPGSTERFRRRGKPLFYSKCYYLLANCENRKLGKLLINCCYHRLHVWT